LWNFSAIFSKESVVFLIPLVLVTAWISLVVTPWSYKTERTIIGEAQTLTPISGLVPGRFNTLPNEAGVFYTKSISDSGELSNIWIQRQSQVKDAEQDLILVAPIGRFEWVDGRLILALEDGYSYIGMHDHAKTASGDIEVQAFKRF
jgi:lipopolysaccharide export system permease protein